MSTLNKHFISLIIVFCMMFGISAQAMAGPATSVVLGQAGVVNQEVQYKKLLVQRGALEKKLEQLERQYDKLALDIDKIKRKGVGTLNRSEIQGLLRQGRQLATHLSKVQRDIQSVDASLKTLGHKMLAQIDAQMKQLERQIGRKNGVTRSKAVAKLNALSKRRATYARPLPQVNHKKIGAMLAMAEGLDNPDDMLAMADELQDAEEGVRKKLTWIAKRLKELKGRQKLLRRAQAFSKQERFFEESARGRQVGRVATKKIRNKPVDTGNVQNDQDNQQAPTDSGDPSRAPNESFNANNDQVTADAGTPTATPPVKTETDPFTSTKENVIISKEADPAMMTTNTKRGGDVSLGKRITILERNQQALKKQASALKNKATTLRKQANAVD